MALRGVSIALACRTFGVSETCYRYSAKLKEENEQRRPADRANEGEEELGLWSLFSLPAQCPGASVEPQAHIPHLP